MSWSQEAEGRKEVEAQRVRAASSVSTFTTRSTQAPARWASCAGAWALPFDCH